jgi:tRNA(Arg) A34 adenosine deaminase TadA
MTEHADPVLITIPRWIDELVQRREPLADDDACMALTIELSRENVARGGGPFGALVCAEGKVIAAGVNRVLDSGFSLAHAEIIALLRAQQMLKQTSPTHAALCLYASTEPCCQCFGAVVWSGVTRLVCGALTADAEAIGFDEGPKPAAWPSALEQRGLEVKLGVRSAEARAVLQEYAQRGGPIYGLRSPSVRS